MGVFDKAYFSKFQDYDSLVESKEIVEDNVFLQIYLTTVVNTFHWLNLPIGMPKFMMERNLQLCGRVAFFEDNGEYKIFPCFPCGALNEYGEYDEYTIIAKNGKTWVKKAEDIEICFNNCFKLPYYMTIKHFADKSAYALDAVDAGLRRAMLPPIIKCESETQMKTLSNVLGDHQTLKEFVAIFGEELDANSIQRLPVFDNKETDVLALFDVYVRYRNLFYSTFGINNVEIQKRERLTQAEGSGNDEIVRYSLLDDMEYNRRDFCERVMEHFGYELDFELERDATTVFELQETNEDKIRNAEIEITKGANIQKPVNEDVDSTKEVTNESQSE